MEVPPEVMRAVGVLAVVEQLRLERERLQRVATAPTAK
jgi:hypothetical protein